MQANASFEGKAYGIPTGTDGRVLYYNKKLFAQAGLPADWAADELGRHPRRRDAR